ncbi:protein OBERON 2 [Lycium ferocissimum]|uniref:protein OBERON 2 n=1 Tax=Lycium ferocissimum TaxID=112874 RepID=UPI002815B5C0|nr:protein OBERON 2 [Lycium ferocissimum]
MSSNEDPVEIDSPAACNGDTPSTNENGLHLYPVSANDSGEGLPYAPVDWPSPGDKWAWKVGKRIASAGYFLDRYLYLPKRLRGKRSVFASRLSVEQYVRSEFPSVDVNEFFASFSWKIPSKLLKGDCYAEVTSSGLKSDSQLQSMSCKAGNSMCASLIAGDPSPETMFCDICCSEPGFCRDCCCILCCLTITSAYGGYSYIRCEATVDDGYICGHITHLECAIRSYMAGTVGGSIGLDAGFLCRRCDSRTDLIPHVTKLLNICRSIDSRDDIEKILNVGICILHGSRKTNAKQLLRHIKSAMAKLHKGACVGDVFKEEQFIEANGETPHHDTGTSVCTHHGESIVSERSSPEKMTSNFDHRVESLKLEIEIDQTLQALRKSQEFEYKLAVERLFAQKNYIMNLYEQLDVERSDLSSHTSMVETDTLLDVVLKRIDQIKREVLKLKEMKQVQNGFGSTSKEMLKDHFGLETKST